MANNCYYNMKIIGKKDNIKEFLSRVKGEYKEGKSFGRFFEADIYEEGFSPKHNLPYVRVCGDCAWSVLSCIEFDVDKDLMPKTTKELKLIVEIWSEEPELGFQEHFIFDKGKKIASEEKDFRRYEWDLSEYPDYKDYKEENADPEDKDFPTEKEFMEEGIQDDSYLIIEKGGFGEKFESENI